MRPTGFNPQHSMVPPETASCDPCMQSQVCAFSIAGVVRKQTKTRDLPPRVELLPCLGTLWHCAAPEAPGQEWPPKPGDKKEKGKEKSDKSVKVSSTVHIYSWAFSGCHGGNQAHS